MYRNLPELPKDWQIALKSILPNDCLQAIDQKLNQSDQPIYPPKNQIFRALELTPFDSVKVLLLGQDPYHGANEACGICFGVPDGVKVPPSLKNLTTELQSDLKEALSSYELVEWAKQGILMLNRTLTVLSDQPLSHKNLGWDVFLDAIMKALIQKKEKMVFVALGKESEKFFKNYQALFKYSHKLLAFPHPSPLSAYRGFFGSKMFSKINQTLEEIGESPISFGKKL